jgi:hypothetical protein
MRHPRVNQSTQGREGNEGRDQETGAFGRDGSRFLPAYSARFRDAGIYAIALGGSAVRGGLSRWAHADSYRRDARPIYEERGVLVLGMPADSFYLKMPGAGGEPGYEWVFRDGRSRRPWRAAVGVGSSICAPLRPLLDPIARERIAWLPVGAARAPLSGARDSKSPEREGTQSALYLNSSPVIQARIKGSLTATAGGGGWARCAAGVRR